MDQFVTAFRELDAPDLDVMAVEFYRRMNRCLVDGKDGWANIYRLIAVAAIDARSEK
ncbi:hypothetical protein [Micromonospora sp. NPDC005710]|uniref:hypothetical protein n=1 Tax=Micromonospora sp. NPDC005710 TaxID=3157051 RepID=UPI003402DAB6